MRFLLQPGDPLESDGPNVVRLLCASPRRIAAVYVYDKRGTALFERQCATPEYYLRRAEMTLLRDHCAEIVDYCGVLPIVELGAGTGDKTRILLREYARRDAGCDYYPIDVDAETLASAAAGLARAFPRVLIYCLAATYETGMRALPRAATRRLFLFLGSTLGNMELPAIDSLLTEMHRHSACGDYLLIGADLHKGGDAIVRAYNDAAGYGPQSTLNILHHLNRRYDGNFRVERFFYRSQYDSAARKNEIWLDSLDEQAVTLAALDFSVTLREGEPLGAEVMWKFEPDELAARLDRAGFSPLRRWIEPIHTYGLFLHCRR